jgi:hypothetical protein
VTFVFFIFKDISWKIIKSQNSFSKKTLWNIYVNVEYLIIITNFILLIRFSSKKKKKKRKKKSQSFFSKRILIYINLLKINIIYNIK